MANLCDNTVVLTGNPEKLQKVVDAVDAAAEMHDYVTLEAVQEQLGFDCTDWGRSYDIALGSGRSGLDTSELEAGELRLYVVTVWGPVTKYWDALCKALDLEWCCHSEADGECEILNDPDGKFFPETCFYDSQGESAAAEKFGTHLDFEYFSSTNDAAEALNRASGENKTFDEWEEFLSLHDEFGSLKRICRY